MKKFDIIFLLIFLQTATLLTGVVQIQEGVPLISPYLDNAFLGSFSNIANSTTSTFNAVKDITTTNVFASQPFDICIPVYDISQFKTSNWCSTLAEIPGVGILNLLQELIGLTWSIITLAIGLCIVSFGFGTIFYYAILQSIIPQTTETTIICMSFSLILTMIQSLIITWDLLKLILSILFNPE
jgi:hypothetical protein